jgi:FkbM family methyltransferase
MATTAAELPFGAWAPTAVQRAVIVAARGSFLRRGFYRKHIAPLLMRLRPGPIDWTTGAARFRFDVRDNTTDSSALLNPGYDAEELAFLAGAGEGSTFVDIGANTGFYAITMAGKLGPRGRVVAIEPEPRALARLTWNVGLNPALRIAVVPTAVGATISSVRFRTFGNLGYGHVDPEGDIAVSMKPFLDVVREQGLAAIDAMKIDVEGFEDQVLIPFFDAAPPELRPRRVVIEHLWRDKWRTDCIARMLSLGYREAARQRSNTMLALG